MARSNGSSTVLQTDELTCRFGGLVAVDRVSLELDQGELVAIIGPNGAGKTTLFNLISGQIRPTAGTVHFRGENVTRSATYRRARMGIGRTFQIVHTIGTLTVLQNAMVGAFAKYPKRKDAAARAEQVLNDVGLEHRADVTAADLTLAERGRLEVARALATNPDLLMLDEVMAGLNPVESEAAIEIVRKLNEDGLTILLIEHDLKVVRSLAERAVVLNFGKVIARGTPGEVLEDPEVVSAYLGSKDAK